MQTVIVWSVGPGVKTNERDAHKHAENTFAHSHENKLINPQFVSVSRQWFSKLDCSKFVMSNIFLSEVQHRTLHFFLNLKKRL